MMTSAVRNGTPTAREALTDLLKFLFNILLHYPKVYMLSLFFIITLIRESVDGSRTPDFRNYLR